METLEEKVPRLLTTKELSRLTSIAYWRLLQLVAQGKGPPHMRIGSTLRFPEDGVVQWILRESNNRVER